MTTEQIVVGVVVVAAVGIVLLLAWIPGYCARERGHPSASAIAICGWLGMVMPILWLVAFIWAHTGPDYSEWVKAEKAARKNRSASAGCPLVHKTSPRCVEISASGCC